MAAAERAVEASSPLVRLIAEEIRANGPMTIARYMALCLTHPEHGYYTGRDPLGRAGDFTTAPEISQMFGELLGLWLVQTWLDQGQPAPFRLVELGPGRGTLMADALRASRIVPGFAEAADLWLVEASPRLRAEQAQRLPGAKWADDLAHVPDGPVFLVANEFLDALPVRQWIASPEGLRECLIGLDDSGSLVKGLSPPIPGGPSAGWLERCPAAEEIMETAAGRIAAEGGAALFIDYGYTAADRPAGPTLQALRKHQSTDPLAQPGEADLTCLVDFDRMAQCLSHDGISAHLTTQGALLSALGIHQRAAKLSARDPQVSEALNRLTAPERMGRLFKALACLPVGQAAPGFEDQP